MIVSRPYPQLVLLPLTSPFRIQRRPPAATSHGKDRSATRPELALPCCISDLPRLRLCFVTLSFSSRLPGQLAPRNTRIRRIASGIHIGLPICFQCAVLCAVSNSPVGLACPFGSSAYGSSASLATSSHPFASNSSFASEARPALWVVFGDAGLDIDVIICDWTFPMQSPAIKRAIGQRTHDYITAATTYRTPARTWLDSPSPVLALRHTPTQPLPGEKK